MLIMRDLLLYGKDSFSEFLCSDEKIATNIWTDRLNVLLQEGFVTKHTAPTNKSKFLYRPTEKAIELIPILSEIILHQAGNASLRPGALSSRDPADM
jgi:DNA-binding HxlR family transcriptional regulator